MSLKVAIYARYSSDLQSDASIEDQLRLCTEKAKAEGWDIVEVYSDAGISGASLMRPGIQSLISAAMNGAFDIVLCEALDRLSRALPDISGLYQRMNFAGCKIITLSEGEISTMHIGLKGTMNELFLQDLAAKTKRGMRGKVENGQSSGGISYGYKKVVKKFDANGEAIKGDREIDHEEAKVIRRIFQEYANDNKSPKAIAADLNAKEIPSPSGKKWGQSAINGNRKRGTGILNNDLYRGVLVWNRQKFIKDPSTGKRVPRHNPESEWIIKDVPELRIVSQELWDGVKARQAALERKGTALWQSNRPQYLLSGLLKCGQCGGGYAKINATHYGCSANKNKGDTVCDNRRTIKRENLEGIVLNALRTHLMREELIELFCAEYTKHMNILIAAQHQDLKRLKNEQLKIAKEKANIIAAIKKGIDPDLVKDELEAIKQRESDLEAKLAVSGREPQPFVHPAMANRYHAEVNTLIHALQDGQGGEAREHVRSLIEKIVLSPRTNEDGLQIDLYGDLAGILTIAMENKDMMKNSSSGLEESWRLPLLSSNEANKGNLQDSVGSGGALQTLSSLLICAYDIASNPLSTAALLSGYTTPMEGVRDFKGADYSNTSPEITMAGGENG